ncbi:DUF3649 domain-containing protein [Pseudomonas sp. NPDC090202]|uniref:DUF3649 domain-containing protein n=1 Tax=unclassified Pseudomonas TaxID=196821 RepID=UPI00380AA003
METATMTTVPPAKRVKKTREVPLRWRLAVASRVLAALLGGYLLSSLASVCMAQFLPLARAEAVVLGMTLSFLVYLPAVLWCFACRTAWRAWLGVLLPSAVLGALYAAGRWLT